jgi:hypothetical protein
VRVYTFAVPVAPDVSASFPRLVIARDVAVELVDVYQPKEDP